MTDPHVFTVLQRITVRLAGQRRKKRSSVSAHQSRYELFTASASFAAKAAARWTVSGAFENPGTDANVFTHRHNVNKTLAQLERVSLCMDTSS